MQDENKRNLMYFEASSMRALHRSLEVWQNEHAKRLLSVSIQKDSGKYCCIALSNPNEVIICDGSGASQAGVSQGALEIKNI
ncbi:MAG: hypothetical protein KJ970_04895 [Candidatus Eisenbacteria bacterium]|uniref:Uncharacterized protein n=1 Tax=Eiseniibacteriota bacterium TaxID=2212470 RepID=A0A948RSL6_UNCEI|nr:hypothetical protein [Candidatus Eisenbacteria bacterium]MBU1950220.1 hypothetical protein [Candidatus Eisenbacteria bacterium]MBU2690245.1 hypothetical protein [Candidatus Eisenbacteria bacterium]